MRLQEWFANVAEDLKISGEKRTPNLMQMQALALQLAYDNIQIVLHRQAVFGPKASLANPKADKSIEQLIESALRTARTPEDDAIVPICQYSHAAMHAGICLFTAGVVLSALTLAHRAQDQSKELLSALERIIRFFEHFPGQHYPLATQCLQILQNLYLKCQVSCSRAHPELDPSNTTRDGKQYRKVPWYP